MTVFAFSLLMLLVVLLAAVLIAVLRATRSELREIATSVSQLAEAHRESFAAMTAVTKMALAGLDSSSDA